jgi:hypothetical protein
MRVIVNIQSVHAAKAFGWRAREIHVNGKNEVELDEAMRATKLANGSTMHDYIFEGDHLLNEWILYVNGIKMTGIFDTKTMIKDNTQIHLLANPHAKHAE